MFRGSDPAAISVSHARRHRRERARSGPPASQHSFVVVSPRLQARLTELRLSIDRYESL